MSVAAQRRAFLLRQQAYSLLLSAHLRARGKPRPFVNVPSVQNVDELATYLEDLIGTCRRIEEHTETDVVSAPCHRQVPSMAAVVLHELPLHLIWLSSLRDDLQQLRNLQKCRSPKPARRLTSTEGRRLRMVERFCRMRDYQLILEKQMDIYQDAALLVGLSQKAFDGILRTYGQLHRRRRSRKARRLVHEALSASLRRWL